MKRRGFTMLEVMIAVAFIGIALVAVIRTQGQGIRLADEARFTARAVYLARYVLAQSQAQPNFDPGTTSTPFDEPLEHFAWDREVTPVSGLPGVYKVQVWVHHADDEPQTGVTLQGMILRSLR
jgi:general secretion pathway protein I